MNGKVVIVTGGFGVLGRSVATQIAAAGAAVALVDCAPHAPDGLPASMLAVPGVDLATPDGAAQAIATVAARFDRIDGLANIAGGFVWETVGDGDTASWDAMYRMNVCTALNASRAVLPHLRQAGGGHIVNVGAQGALRAGIGMGAYAAAKSAVHRLTEALAEELKDDAITVNAVLPSIIDTPRNRADMPDADFARWVRPEDIAAVVGFLLGDGARAVTGALVPVTGRL